jgi:hypothetical protein
MKAGGKEYIENSEGVHLLYGEHTLCGDAFDISEDDIGYDDGPMASTTKSTVTCPRCILVIHYCRGVRTS